MFESLKDILTRFESDSLELRNNTIGSTTREKKKQLHLYGKQEVSIGSRKSQQTYVAGIIQQKGYVGFYFMPIYSHPDVFNSISSELKNMLKGKSCFHVKELSPSLEKELGGMIQKGIDLYSKEEWI